ncbi:hypothetical protein CSW64_12135 [Caulobacter mirabilis]|uniref:Uncharacterized protein n=1 Tax=Caulobacter mirabilis TaxID=69666 RepID=A0A2D2AYL8_9CAUL|nr:hypothetical protein CSW64_12135 [Caulobacter mirabilis]
MMRKLLTGLALMSVVAVAGTAFAQTMQEEASPTPGECYSPCAQQYHDATDRIRCIARCCGC